MNKKIITVVLLFFCGSIFATMQLPNMLSSKYDNSSSGLPYTEANLSGIDIAGITVDSALFLTVLGVYSKILWSKYSNRFKCFGAERSNNLRIANEDVDNRIYIYTEENNSKIDELSLDDDGLPKNIEDDIDLFNKEQILQDALKNFNINQTQGAYHSFAQEGDNLFKDANFEDMFLVENNLENNLENNFQNILNALNEFSTIDKFPIPLAEAISMPTSSTASPYSKDYTNSQLLTYSVMSRYSSLNVNTDKNGNLNAYATLSPGDLLQRTDHYYADNPTSTKYNALYLQNNIQALGDVTDTKGNILSGTSPSIAFFTRDNIGDPLFLLTYIGNNNKLYGMILEYGIGINQLISLTDPEPFDYGDGSQSLCYVGQYNGSYYFLESHNGYGEGYENQEWADILSVTNNNNNPEFNTVPLSQTQYSKSYPIQQTNGTCFIQTDPSSPLAYVVEALTTTNSTENNSNNIYLDTLKIDLSNNNVKDEGNILHMNTDTNGDIGYIGMDANGNYIFTFTYYTSDSCERIESIVLSTNSSYGESTSYSGPSLGGGLANQTETGYQYVGGPISINGKDYYFNWKFAGKGKISEQPTSDEAYFEATADTETGFFAPLVNNQESITFVALKNCKASQIETNTGETLDNYLVSGQESSYSAGDIYTVTINESNGEVTTLDNQYTGRTITSNNTGFFSATANGQETITFHCVGPSDQKYTASQIPVSIVGGKSISYLISLSQIPVPIVGGGKSTSYLSSFNPSITSFVPGNNYTLTVDDTNGFINSINGGFAVAVYGSTSQYSYHFDNDGLLDLSFIANKILDTTKQDVTLNYSYPDGEVGNATATQSLYSLGLRDLNNIPVPKVGDVVKETANDSGTTSTVIQNITQGPVINEIPLYMGVATSSNPNQSFDNMSPNQQLQAGKGAAYGGFQSLTPSQQLAYVQAATTNFQEQTLINDDSKDFCKTRYASKVSENNISVGVPNSNVLIREKADGSINVAYADSNNYPNQNFCEPIFNVNIVNNNGNINPVVCSLIPVFNSSNQNLVDGFEKGNALTASVINNSLYQYTISSGGSTYTLMVIDGGNNQYGIIVTASNNSGFNTQQPIPQTNTYAYVYFGGTYLMVKELQSGTLPTIGYTPSTVPNSNIVGTFSISGQTLCQVEKDGLYDSTGSKLCSIPTPVSTQILGDGDNHFQLVVPTTTDSLSFSGNDIFSYTNLTNTGEIVNLADHKDPTTNATVQD